MAKDSGGRIGLRGRFSPGARVRLVRVDGAHVLRPPDGAEAEAMGVVDEDGYVEFTSGIEVGARYFICGYHYGQPLEVRVTGRSEDDPSSVLEQAPVGAERQKLSDGSFVDEPPEQHQDTNLPEGATWLGQHQVPEGTLQRSDTPRGAAQVISAEERERALRQWRKQEPTDAVVETEGAEDHPARTSEPPDLSAAAKSKEAKK